MKKKIMEYVQGISPPSDKTAEQLLVSLGFLTVKASRSHSDTPHDHTQTHHTRKDSSGRGISPTQRPLPDNTQHSQDTDIHATWGIRTRNPSKRTASDSCPRPRSHWNRQKRQTSIHRRKRLLHTRMLQ
jgi:hypothetical protein